MFPLLNISQKEVVVVLVFAKFIKSSKYTSMVGEKVGGSSLLERL